MDKQEQEKLLQELKVRQKQLREELKLFTTENPEVKGDYKAHHHLSDSSDTADEEAQGVTEYERERALEQNLELELKEINKTIEQIESGNYGKCTNCSSKIEPKRLEAIPTARFCMDCAEKAALV